MVLPFLFFFNICLSVFTLSKLRKYLEKPFKKKDLALTENLIFDRG